VSNRRQGRRSFGKRNQSNLVWAAIQTTQSLITTATAAFPIIAGSDWFGAAAGRGSAMLMSIRGWISLGSVGGTATTIAMAIVKADKDTSLNSPLDVATYVEDDILWTGGWNKPASATEPFMNFDVNVKAKRKISSDDEIFLVIDAADTNVTEISLVLRGLLKLNNG